ncbi:MAG: hypothetical protein ACOX69_02095 [Coriobacteriales bacterium]|jgi:type II secretory pathway pseudopilin PulG
MMKMRQSLSCRYEGRARAGFTLTETLAALLVLVILTGVVALGVSAAVRIYNQEQFASQAQVLSDTIDTALSDAYRFMDYDEDSGTFSVEYAGGSDDVVIESTDSSGVSPVASIDGSSTTDRGQVYLQGTSVLKDSEETSDTLVRLLNAGVYGNCTVAIDDDFTCTEKKVSGGYTVYSADASLSRHYDFTFRPLADIDKASSSSSSSSSESGGDSSGSTSDTSTIEGGRVLATDTEKSYVSSMFDSWNLDNLNWVKLQDKNGTVFYGLRPSWSNDTYAMVYYKHKYYVPLQDGTQVNQTPLPSSGEHSFNVDDMTDGNTHDYGWGGNVTWKLCS